MARRKRGGVFHKPSKKPLDSARRAGYYLGWKVHLCISRHGAMLPDSLKDLHTMADLLARCPGMKKEDVYSTDDIEWRNDVSGKTIREGDRIDLGDLKVSILEIPGHSSCCIAAYVPKLKALFPTDGGGIPFDETIVTSGNSNFTKYQQSLERLKDLEVEVYGADHYGYVIGEEAREFISKSIEMAKRNRALMEEVYRSTRDIDAAAQKLISSFYEENPSYFLSPEIFLDVYRQMVRHIVSAIEGKA